MVPDEKYFCFENIIYLFYPFLCSGRSVRGTLPLQPGVWGPLKASRLSQRVLDALRYIPSQRVSRCPEMHS